MGEPRFQAGDRVRVRWMQDSGEATVLELLLTGGRPHKIPHYLLAVDGVEGRLGYRDDEIEPLEGQP